MTASGRIYVFLLVVAAVATVAVMSCAPRATWAQTPALTLADLNPDNDLELDFAAVVTSGGTANSGGNDLYATGGWGTRGSITEGDLAYGSSNTALGRIRTLNNNTGLRINGSHGSTPNMPGTFNGAGERSSSSGYRFYLLWAVGGDRIEIDSFTAGSTNALTLPLSTEMTATQLTSWRGVDSGDRYILALGKTRATAPALSSPASSNVTQTTATISATVANPDGELLTGHFRHRVQGATNWPAATTATTTGTTFSSSLSSLAAATIYEFEIATNASFANKVTGTFTTSAVPVNHPPAFAAASYVREVAENQPPGSNVGQPVTATDPDGTTPTYSITGANPGNFAIGASTGQITTGQMLDYETTASYIITVRAQDPGGLSASATVTINVVDANEPPVFSRDSYNRSVYENSPAGTAVGQPITAADTDALTYSLSGNGAASFAVDANGQITVAVGSSLDYETTNSYSLTLTATDTSGGADTAGVSIGILDLREVELLGRVEIELGSSGNDYGFNTGYGRLVAGQFPGELFGNGAPRAITAIYEDADAFWYLVYSGGTGDDWNAELDEVLLEVYYADQRDSRAFVLGGFIEERNGNTLKLDPPLQSRDWDSRSGENVVIEFRHHTDQAVPSQAAVIASPQAAPNTIVAFVSDTTPGGPVVAQNLIVLLVYGLWAIKKNHSTASMFTGGLILVLTPWVSVIFQMGTPMSAVINAMNLLLGAYVYKYFFEGREQYS